MRFKLLFILSVMSLPTFSSNEVTRLRTIGLESPIGIESTPDFSWEIVSTERGVQQSAYEICVSEANGTIVWNSGKVASSRQTGIPYEGTPLQSRTQYLWTVTVYDQDGNASEQGKSTFETGILTQSEWNKAQWIASKTSPYRAMVTIYPTDEAVHSRYVRLKVKATGPRAATDPNYSFVQIAEVEIYNKKGENVARSAKFTATNAWELTNFGWSVNYINDGIIAGGSTNGFTTTANSTTTTIVADLGEEQDITRIVLFPRQDTHAVGDAEKVANFPSSYTIETGITGKDYVVLYEAKNAEAPSYENNTNVPYLGCNFTVEEDKEVMSARLYASALGVFTMRLNGKKVSQNVLEPGESAYDKHVLYSTYDVTDLIADGRNTLIAQVAGGIANMSSMSDRFVKIELANNAATTSLRAMLFITYSDGTSDCVTTDSSWGTHQSPTIGSNWYGGEAYDARMEVDGIYSVGYDVSGWEKCETVEPTFTAPSVSTSIYPIGDMRAREYMPLRVVETWPAVSVVQNKAGNYLVDFGQNFAGTYSFTLKAPAGTTITIYDSELQADNACKFEYMYEPSGITNKTLDTYTFKGKDEGETWGPEFMYHGFRYLEISGLPSAPLPSDFIAMRIRSDMKVVGSFETSKTLLNDIHRICFNGMQSQLYNTVTDCPHREKLGWLEVPNLLYQSLCYNFDMKPLYGKIIMDAFDSQGTSGYVPSTVPHFMRAYDDDLNWGGAAIAIPWRIYKQYGDMNLMTKYYDQMKRLITYYGTLTDNYIIRNDYSPLSDWGQETSGVTQMTSSSFTLTCSYYNLLRAMSEMAQALGYNTDSSQWLQTAANVKSAFNQRFFKDGVYEYGNQANFGMPLYYGLVDDEYKAEVAHRLAEAVKASNYSIKTGEIGLCPTLMSLAAYGYNDVVYKMALKTTYPSYGYWVKQGATTSLEYWDMSLSQNHCMMDHIEEWFFSQLGGITNTGEAYETVRICPWIPLDMASADISLESPRGKIRMAWNRSKTRTDYSITVPAGAKAFVYLPIVKGEKLYEGNQEISAIASVGDVVYADTLVSFTLGSGNYEFKMNASNLVDSVDEDDDTPEEDGTDITEENVLNHGFEKRNTGVVPWAPTNWTLDFPDTNGNYGSMSTSDQRNVNPTEGTYDWHIWYDNNYISVRLYQSLPKLLPPGRYLLKGDLRCVNNAAITGKQRLFATIGKEVINETTIFSEPYNADGSVYINSIDFENSINWRTLSLKFSLSESSFLTIGFDCPQGENTGLGGFQVDNVRLYRLDTNTGIHALNIAPSLDGFYSLSGIRLHTLPASGVVICKEGEQYKKLFLK